MKNDVTLGLKGQRKPNTRHASTFVSEPRASKTTAIFF